MPFGGRWAGTGAAYLQFVVNTLKPLIDGTFRTIKSRANTGIIGSSLGGLISTHAFFKNASTFGFMGALSPAYWPGNGAIYERVKKLPGKHGRIYLDNGVGENSAQRMVNFLTTLKGYAPDVDLKYVQDPHGQHDEASWARRLPGALRFLLGRIQNPESRVQTESLSAKTRRCCFRKPGAGFWILALPYNCRHVTHFTQRSYCFYHWREQRHRRGDGAGICGRRRQAHSDRAPQRPAGQAGRKNWACRVWRSSSMSRTARRSKPLWPGCPPSGRPSTS